MFLSELLAVTTQQKIIKLAGMHYKLGNQNFRNLSHRGEVEISSIPYFDCTHRLKLQANKQHVAAIHTALVFILQYHE